MGLDEFTATIFLHRRDLPGHGDGKGHSTQMFASRLGSDLLLPPPSPLQLVGSQGQGHSPQGCGKENLPQAWRQPQLRESRLQEKREAAGDLSPGESRGRQSCPGSNKEQGMHWALQGYLFTRTNEEAATSRGETWPASLKCEHRDVKRGLGTAKGNAKEITSGGQQGSLTPSVMILTAAVTEHLLHQALH